MIDIDSPAGRKRIAKAMRQLQHEGVYTPEIDRCAAEVAVARGLVRYTDWPEGSYEITDLGRRFICAAWALEIEDPALLIHAQVGHKAIKEMAGGVLLDFWSSLPSGTQVLRVDEMRWECARRGWDECDVVAYAVGR